MLESQIVLVDDDEVAMFDDDKDWEGDWMSGIDTATRRVNDGFSAKGLIDTGSLS